MQRSPKLRRRTAAMLGGLAIGALALGACGGGDDSGSSTDGPSTADVVVDAGPGLKFDKDSYSAAAGEITFEYLDKDAIPHTLVVEGRESDMKLTVSGSGESDSGSLTLDPGSYTLYCDVAGHRAGGMEATLVVQ